MENFEKPEIVLETETILVNSKGHALEEDTSETIFAKYYYEKTESKQNKKHYVLTYNNDLYDPLGPDSHRQKRLPLKLKQVAQNTKSKDSLPLGPRPPHTAPPPSGKHMYGRSFLRSKKGSYPPCYSQI